MLNVAQYARTLLLEQAMAAHRANMGMLLSPAHVNAAAASGQRGLRVGSWHLCGYLHPAMFALARNAPLHHLGKTCVSASGTTYLVLAQQVESWQHRFALQLVGNQMKELALAACAGRCALFLGNAGKTEGLMVPGNHHLRTVFAKGLEVASAPTDLMALGAETCNVALELLGRDALAGEGLPTATQVCVTMVQSDDMRQATFETIRRRAQQDGAQRAG